MTDFSVCHSSLAFSLSTERSGSPKPQLKVSISWHIWASQLKGQFTFWDKAQSAQTLLHQKVPYLGSHENAAILQLCLRGRTPQSVWRESLAPLSTGSAWDKSVHFCGSLFCTIRYYFKSMYAWDSVLDKSCHKNLCLLIKSLALLKHYFF